MFKRDWAEAARGRWRHILLAAGVDQKHLTGKHTECPVCGGTDRFRWDNKDGSGSSICSQCGARSGIDLVIAVRGLEFIEARAFVLAEVGRAPVEIPRARRQIDDGMARSIWSRAVPLDGRDPASRYLASRGIRPAQYPSQVRFLSRAAFKHDEHKTTWHPALLSKFVSADTKRWTLQATFLEADGTPAKGLPEKRRNLPLPVPLGGSVRLAPSAETMGVAEGVETALSASIIHEVPVWATLNSGLMIKWEPPETARCVLIFADADPLYGGQAAAYALAHRLALKKLHVEVRLPPDIGSDWNDVLQSEKEVA